MMPTCTLTVDVEDWFHILDTPAAPSLDAWDGLESVVERGMDTVLEALDRHHVRATFFWLGWIAQRHQALLRRCAAAGHEIASHGYAHVLAFRIGARAFSQDLLRAKGILENISGVPVRGYRAPGFGITPDTPWAFDLIRQSGHEYDCSIFPARRAHGGWPAMPPTPFVIPTDGQSLVELPVSTVQWLGVRVAPFGGGYFRLSPSWLIHLAANSLARQGQPLMIYLHPREFVPDHPRLPLTAARRFKSYINLRSTLPKLESLCRKCRFVTAWELGQTLSQQSLPTVNATEPLPAKAA